MVSISNFVEYSSELLNLNIKNMSGNGNKHRRGNIPVKVFVEFHNRMIKNISKLSESYR